MEKDFLYKIVKTKENPKNYRIRIYDRDSHDEFENGKGRWLRDEDTMSAVIGSHRSSIIECHSVDFAFTQIDAWLNVKKNTLSLNPVELTKLPPTPAMLEQYTVILYAEKD